MYEFSAGLIATMAVLACVKVAAEEKTTLPLLFIIIPLFVVWLLT